MKVYINYMLSACVASLLLGCGGDSSNNDANSSEAQQQIENKKVVLSGVAVDDLIVNGVVNVYTVSKPKRKLLEGRTDSTSGSYTLKTDYEGVVVLEVTCDSNSLMLNPNTNKTKVCEDDLSLQSAAVLSPDIKELEVNISPISDLVVRQMVVRSDSEEITKEDLEASQYNIGQIFGFDPLGDSPVEDEMYKKTVGSLRQLADKKEMTMVELIKEINTDTVDGESGDDGEIAKELAVVMEDNGVKNTFTENNGIVEPKESVVAPIPSPTAVPTSVPTAVPNPSPTATPPPPSDIFVSKAFFNDLRTQAMSMIDYDDTGKAGFLDTESEALGTAMENIALNTNLVAEYSVGIIGLVTEAVDEGVDSKKIEINNEENNNDSQKMMQKTTATVSRTVEVTKSADSKIWNYVIEENTSVSYAGTVTLPDANVSSITASNFTTLTAKFEGKLPLRDIDSLKISGEQSVKLDLDVKKTSSGADLELKEVSIANGSENVAIKTLKATVEYDHNSETDEVTMKSVTLDTITLKATADNYLIDGKLDVDYVTNRSIAGNGFEKEIDNSETRVSGEVRCVGEHNEQNNMSNDGNMDGDVVYTDKLGVEHSITIENHGYFRDNIDGNVEQLADGERIYANTYDGDENNYTNYLGLTFDNISVSSSSCSNIILDDVRIDVFEDNDVNRTYVGTEIFCVDSLGNRSDISDATGTFTDALGVNHTFEVDEHNHNRLFVLYEGNTETRGEKYYRAFGKVLPSTPTFSVTGSSCANPKFERYSIRGDSYTEGKFYNSGVLPKKAKFVGSIKNTITSGEINAELNVELKNAEDMNLSEGADDKAILKVTLQGKIKMPSRPEMILNLGYDAPEEPSFLASPMPPREPTVLTFSYQYDTSVLNARGEFDENMDNGTVKFTGTNGIKLVIKIEDGETLYGAESPVTRNGRKIGELQDRAGVPVIKYTDGSFESLP